MPLDVEKADILTKHSTKVFASIDSAGEEGSDGEEHPNEGVTEQDSKGESEKNQRPEVCAFLKLASRKLKYRDDPGEDDSLPWEDGTTSNRSDKPAEKVWPETLVLSKNDEDASYK